MPCSAQRRLVARVVAARQQRAVHARVQRLDAAAEHLGDAGQILDARRRSRPCSRRRPRCRPSRSARRRARPARARSSTRPVLSETEMSARLTVTCGPSLRCRSRSRRAAARTSRRPPAAAGAPPRGCAARSPPESHRSPPATRLLREDRPAVQHLVDQVDGHAGLGRRRRERVARSRGAPGNAGSSDGMHVQHARREACPGTPASGFSMKPGAARRARRRARSSQSRHRADRGGSVAAWSASAKTRALDAAPRRRAPARTPRPLLEQTPAIVAARPCTRSISACRFVPAPETSTPTRSGSGVVDAARHATTSPPSVPRHAGRPRRPRAPPATSPGGHDRHVAERRR